MTGFQSSLIVVFGDLMNIITAQVKKLPKDNETVKGTNIQNELGGISGNQAIAAAKLGGTVAIIGRIGKGSRSDDYRIALQHAKIDCQCLQECNETLGTTIIFVSNSTKAHIVGAVSGANGLISEADLQNANKKLQKAAVLLVNLVLYPSLSIKAMQMTEAMCILHARPLSRDLPDEIYSLPLFIIACEEDASDIGFKVTSHRERRIFVKYFMDKNCQNLILLSGTGGAYYNTPNENMQYILTPHVEAIDNSSYVDAFVGAFSYLLIALMNDMHIERIISFALWCAADSTTRDGQQKSYTTESNFQKYYFEKINK